MSGSCGKKLGLTVDLVRRKDGRVQSSTGSAAKGLHDFAVPSVEQVA